MKEPKDDLSRMIKPEDCLHISVSQPASYSYPKGKSPVPRPLSIKQVEKWLRESHQAMISP